MKKLKKAQNGLTLDTSDEFAVGSKPPMKIKDWLDVSKKAMPKMTSNLMNGFVDPTSLYNTLGYADAAIGAFGNSNKQQEEWLQSQTNTDQFATVNPGGDRGDYTVNGSAYGMLRPDQMGAKSPYGVQGIYYPSMEKGGEPKPKKKAVQGGNKIYTSPKGNVITQEDLDKTYSSTGIKWDNPQQYGEWLDQFASPIPQPTKSVVTYPFGRMGEVMTQDEWDYSKKKRGYPDVYSDKVQGKDNFAPGESFANEIRNDIKEFRNLTKNAKLEYGGQTGFGLDLTNIKSSLKGTRGAISKTLNAVDEDDANIEAELGETIFGDFDEDGINEHMNIGGKKHSQGGTPLYAPPASFIFSDSKDMKFKGKELIDFGKSENDKKKYTPAELAKKYDINKYKAILDDKDADPIKIRTAEMMIENYNQKLGKLALLQEEKKDFPNGIPQVAIPYLITQVGPQSFDESQSSETVFATGGEYNPFSLNPLVDPYKGGKTKQGTITPTGKINPYNRPKDHLTEWESIIPGIRTMDNTKAQALMYQYNLTNNPDSIKDMWSTYGLTAKGLKNKDLASLSKNGVLDQSVLTPDNLNKLQDAFTDGYFGVRQLDPQSNTRSLVNPRDRTPVVAPPEFTDRTKPVIPDNSLQPNIFTSKAGQQAPTDFWTQDKINMGYALQNKANIKKYLPWAAPVVGITADPTFYDPTRELASNAEMMNTEMMYTNQFSGPQSAGVRNSSVAGQSAANAANILGRYDNQNVGVANQYAGMNAEIMNNLQNAQSARAKQLYDGNVMANQQYDNSRSQANDVIRKNAVGALNNRQTTQWMNSWYPQFDIDPSSGYVNFAEGTGRSGVTPGGQAPQSYLDVYKQLKQQNPNVADEVLREQAKQLTGQARNTVNSDGDVRSTYNGPTPQQLMQILRSQGG